MKKIIASTLALSFFMLSANAVMAREGAQSVGGGIKCYYANGQKICYKGV